MNESNNTRTTLIRTVISAVAVIIIIIGALDIIPKTIGLVIASALLSASSIWNGVESIIKGRTKTGIINLIAGVILIALCVIVLFL
ncbi:MAG: hypothetical protein IJX24_08025 [Oscillospiraceae bacterium]|nr:hypothetical protein [Oscillospiraceae bacterium]